MMSYRIFLRRVAAISATTVIASSVPAFAQDHADIDRSQIIGNRELPKVLYIVPWKKPMPGDLSGRPMGSVLDEVLAPIDRDVFRRQVKYQTQTNTQKDDKKEAQKNQAATTPVTKTNAN